jgi:hypothetical protein
MSANEKLKDSKKESLVSKALFFDEGKYAQRLTKEKPEFSGFKTTFNA